MSQKLGRPLNGTDVKKHPRIFGKSERIATGAARKVVRLTPGEKTGVQRAVKAAPSGGTPGSLRQWENRLDDYDDYGQYDYDEYESSADYGETD